jgi:hypothetical protein
VSTFVRRAAGAAALAAALTSCAADTPGGTVTSSADCAAVLVLDGHDYIGTGELKQDPATTARRVDASVPACDDLGHDSLPPDEEVEVAVLADVPTDTAVLWNGTVYLRDGAEMPTVVRSWFRETRCGSSAPFDLTGDWLGVTGPKEPRFDGDLRAPYTLSVHVTEGPAAYVGATLRLRADAGTDPGIGPADVKSSLWEGGQVAARVTCVDGRFRAVSLRVPSRAVP